MFSVFVYVEALFMQESFLQDRLKSLKQPSYRLEQALRSYYRDLQPDWSAISTWPESLRTACADLEWSPLRQIEVLAGSDRAVKFLFETADGQRIESVLLRYEDGRNTVCLSSQVGCAAGCLFCATGALGFTRNLSVSEIVDQAVHVSRFLQSENGHLTNAVFMGMGEPFHNPDAVFEAIRLLTDQKKIALGARRVSISTCGVIPGILRQMEEAPQINLAVSLHAPTQALRAELMPVSIAYPLPKLMTALRTYARRTNRKILFEYLLLDGVNDSVAHAEALAALLEDLKPLAHINLIKYHASSCNPDLRPSPEPVRKTFQERLRRLGFPATHRMSFGEGISGACGQLAGKSVEEDIV